MKNFIPLLLIILFSCSSTVQIPKRQKVVPAEGNLYLGTEYKNQDGLLNEQGIPHKPIAYFNYEDFRDFDPAGRIIAEYPYDTVKDLNKIPGDKIGLYHEISIDSSTVNYLSKLLFQAKEPVLNNFYTSKETYRFIWTRAFHDDYIIKVFEETDQTRVETIRIDKQSGKIERKIQGFPEKDFKRFTSMIDSSTFWAQKSNEWVLGLDGSRWTIEAHTPFGYKVLSRFSPGLIYDDELIIRQLGEWLINKSGFEIKEIY